MPPKLDYLYENSVVSSTTGDSSLGQNSTALKQSELEAKSNYVRQRGRKLMENIDTRIAVMMEWRNNRYPDEIEALGDSVHPDVYRVDGCITGLQHVNSCIQKMDAVKGVNVGDGWNGTNVLTAAQITAIAESLDDWQEQSDFPDDRGKDTMQYWDNEPRRPETFTR